MAPWKILLIIVGLTVMCFVVGVSLAIRAQAQVIMQNCKPYQFLVAYAWRFHGELPLGTGISSDGLMTWLVDPSDRSWGVIVKAPNGCAVYFGGSDFEFTAPPPAPAKDG